MNLAFTVKHHSSKCNGRIGQLSLPNGASIETPAALMYTIRGSVPHLTPDLASRLSHSVAQDDGNPQANNLQLLHYFYEHIIGSYGFEAKEERPLMERMYNSRYQPSPSQTSTVIFASLHDVVRKSVLSPGHYGDKFISVATEQRVVKVDNQRFAHWLRQLTGDNTKSLDYDGSESTPHQSESIENHMTWWLSPLYDFVPDVDSGPKRIRKSVDRTLNFLDTLLSSGPMKYQIAGVVEGGLDLEERNRSVRETAKRFSEHPNQMFGYIIDSLFIGESSEERNNVVNGVIKEMNQHEQMVEQPRIMFHCRSVQDIMDAVERGVDIFDSSLPVFLTDMGQAIVLDDSKEADDSAFKQINLWDDSFTRDWQPLMEGCKCFACEQKHTRAYIHHLLQTHEMLAPILLMSHNMHQYFALFARLKGILQS